jgi:flavin reductase (DIM6/NTAB) family NADH-FMN oxidoreductase RutF
MSLKPKVLGRLRSVLLGPTDLPLACDLGLPHPQREIEVSLEGLGTPRDVTQLHSIACAGPFTVCIGLNHKPKIFDATQALSLSFFESGGHRQLLGKIGLRLSATIPTDGPELHLFRTISCANYCLPRMRTYAHYLLDNYQRWKKRSSIEMKLSSLDSRCNATMFICPRPVALVSLLQGDRGSIFPMNLMGPVGEGHFAFALNGKKQAALLVQQVGKLAISNVPFESIPAVRQLAGNHNRQSIDWDQLPFHTEKSSTLGIPVPEFALRVTELKVHTVRQLGSHTFFVANILNEEARADAPEFCMVHGLYQAWRQANISSGQQAASNIASLPA